MMANFIHITNEAIPFVKTGGLADFIYGMSVEQSKIGNIYIFLTNCSEKSLLEFDAKEDILIDFSDFKIALEKYTATKAGINYVYYRSHFNQEIESNFYNNDTQVMLQLLFKSIAIKNFITQEIDQDHTYTFCHDWPSAMIFAFKEQFKNSPIYFLHNFEHQGEIYPNNFVSLPEELKKKFQTIEKKYGIFTLSHLAIDQSDKIFTVSQNYLEELTTGKSIHINDHVCIINKNKFIARTNPIKRGYLHQKYHGIEELLIQKNAAKKNLPVKSKFQLLFLSRPSMQKGFHLFYNDQFNQFLVDLKKLDVGMFILTDANDSLINNKIVHHFSSIMQQHPHFTISTQYSDEFASELLIASDLLLMPSIFEPCGLSQQYAKANACLPIVFPVGGLKETVIDHSTDINNGNGFFLKDIVFSDIVEKIKLFINLHNNKKQYHQVLINAVNSINYWDEVIDQYHKLLNIN